MLRRGGVGRVAQKADIRREPGAVATTTVTTEMALTPELRLRQEQSNIQLSIAV